MQTNWLGWRVPFKQTKDIFEREQNQTPNVNAWLATTEWMSRKVPTNYCNWIRGHAASQWTLWQSIGYTLWKLRFTCINITLIKTDDYKTPNELFMGVKLNISHIWVYGCQAWVYKERSWLELKSQEWSLSVKNWDPRDTSSGMPTDTSKFPMMWNSKNLDSLQKKSHWHSQGHNIKWHQFPEESKEDQNSDLDFVTLNQPQQSPTSPGPSAQVAVPPQPVVPPPAPQVNCITCIRRFGRVRQCHIIVGEVW